MQYRGWVLKAAALAAAGLSVSSVLADPGSDVIVGEIHNAQYNGQANNMASWSLGTTSCNKGDVPFQWLTSSNSGTPGTGENRHPVIGQNLFRVIPGAQGTIRQLSQAWLKHGFTALQNNACNFGCSAYPNGTYLGVGCSDPYDSSLNASQPNAGPKSEVNAATGVFPFPPFGKNTLSGNIDKRLQAPLTDSPSAPGLGVAGALYFGECQYVAQDDAANNNKNNNASYRQLNLTATSISVAGSTQRERPGIYAWKDHGLGLNTPDPSVTVTEVDVAGDGRFLVAVKSWQINANTWHYEYAVHNLNSHRSGQAFRINFPAGVNITNAGTYNVPYHSGEPYSNAPWTLTISSDNVTWAGPTYTGSFWTNTGPGVWAAPTGNDSTANALRWGTMYNFWFDANAAPTIGSGSIALFRPGAAPNPSLIISAPGAPGSSGIPNDECATATPITDGTWGFSTLQATSNPNGPAECLFSGSSAINFDAWFSYVAPNSGNVRISTCGSNFDTKIAAYSACPGSTPNTAIACNDDFDCDNNAATNDLQSQASFTAVAGQTYYLRIGGFNTAQGTVALSIAGPNALGACCELTTCSLKTSSSCSGTFYGVDSSCTTGLCALSYDNCANAQPLSDGVPFQSTTIGASDDGGNSCGTSDASPDLWFSYTPAVTGNVVFSTCVGSDYDTVLSVHTACPSGANEFQLAPTSSSCNDDTTGCGTGRQSRVTVALTAGTRYLIRVAGWQGATGNFTLLTTGGGGIAPPSNDNCIDRPGIPLGSLNVDTSGATTDGPSHTLCDSRSQTLITKDIWFNHPSSGTGTLTITLCASAGSSLDPYLAVYSGSGCADLENRLMACSDQAGACSAPNNASVTIPVQDTVSYTIRAGGYNNTSGPGVLTLAFTPTAGACCVGTTECHVVANAASCIGGSYQGDNSVCEGDAMNPITCCPANFDHVGGVGVADLFGFLDAWFAEFNTSGPNLASDFDHDQSATVADLFGFLDAWFLGCN